MIVDYLKYIISKKMKIKTVYDVGAHNGEWSTAVQNLALPNSKFILFEANPMHEESLSESGFDFFNGTALSKPGVKSVEFFLGPGGHGDSYYKENTKFFDKCESITLPAITLDSVIKKENLPKPDFIKLDTQGSELDILNGAKSIFDTVKLIYVEIPILSYNKGAPTFQEYIDFFKSKNFVPIDIVDIGRMEDTLVQIDVLFMHKDAKNKIFNPNKMVNPFIK